MTQDISEPPRRRTVEALQHESTCSSCGAGDVVVLRVGGGWRCPECSGFGHLEFLPSGNAALSRRAAKASTLTVEVVRANTRRMRMERHGLLVEPAAIEHAARECLSDAPRPRPRRTSPRQEVRASEDEQFQAQFFAAIREQFPGCPADRAEAIALHRTAASGNRWMGRVVDDDVVRTAVSASVRHVDTDFDELLASGVDRDEALARVQQRIEYVVTAWRDGATMLDA